jgi:opacity protein-like surface antigen
MKKIVLSLTALLALSSSAMAQDQSQDSGLYVGLGYGYLDQSSTIGNIKADTTVNSVMLQGGYLINKYVGLEVRLWKGIGSSDTTQSGGNYPGTYDAKDSYAWGAYVKPAYPILNDFKIYGLLGYGATSIKYNNNEISTDGFSWGVGAEYAFTKHVSCFADYTDFIAPSSADFTSTQTGASQSIDTDITTYTVNVGISYKF